MGVVYRAYDRMMNRDVALKTILDIDNPDTLNLFYKEWSTLVTMVHPNVINIYDIGEFEQDGAIKPFFVMPLLPGVTLDRLIKDGSPRLSVSGVVAIIEQAARGLHAAHEQGLVHRDVKPSNIFVMEDGSVKIIDFGIAQTGTPHSNTTVKGTLYYLAPEQLELKPPSPLSDLFALAVVTYEALTRRRPFQAASESDVIEAIKHHSPPPISEVNHEVIYPISQVVHKAMAKQPWHRFFNIREYGEALVKAMRNEPLEYFDSAKIKPRLERASQSFRRAITSSRPRCWRNWRPRAIWTKASSCCAARWTRQFARSARGKCSKTRAVISRRTNIRWRCARSRKRWNWTRLTPLRFR